MNFKRLGRLAASAAAILAAATAIPAGASNSDFGTIFAITAMPNGAVLFHTTGNRIGTHPSCQGAGLDGRYAINASTPQGQNQLSILLTAKAQNRQIYVIGLNVCNIHGDTETVNYFSVSG